MALIKNESGKITGFTNNVTEAEQTFETCKADKKECSFSYVCPDYTTHYKGRHVKKGSVEMEYAFGHFQDKKTFSEIAEIVGQDEANNCCYQNYVVWIDALIMQGKVDSDGFVDFTMKSERGVSKKIEAGVETLLGMYKSGILTKENFKLACEKFGVNSEKYFELTKN
jgi:hypothetical protein